MTVRVTVFVDEQTARDRAAAAFFGSNPKPSDGQFWPHLVGKELCEMLQSADASNDWQLQEVHVYYHLPHRNDPSNRAKRAQVAAWQNQSDLVRPRKFNETKRGQVKGTHVAFALDIFRGASKREYDVGIVLSDSLDVLPVFERFRILGDQLQAALYGATWRAAQEPLSQFPVAVRDQGFECQALDAGVYLNVRDDTPYGDRAAQQSSRTRQRAGRRRRRQQRRRSET